MRARDLAKAQGKEHYKRLRNKCLSLIRRDNINHNLERVRRGGQAAAWSVINHLTGKSRGHELPLPSGAGSAKEAADLANNHYIEKVLNLRKDLKTNMSSQELAPSDSGFKFHCIGVSVQLEGQRRCYLTLAGQRKCWQFVGVKPTSSPYPINILYTMSPCFAQAHIYSVE